MPGEISRSYKGPMSFDSECLTLAEHFLSDCTNVESDHAPRLAQHIQDAIETWLATEEGLGLP